MKQDKSFSFIKTLFGSGTLVGPVNADLAFRVLDLLRTGVDYR